MALENSSAENACEICQGVVTQHGRVPDHLLDQASDLTGGEFSQQALQLRKSLTIHDVAARHKPHLFVAVRPSSERCQVARLRLCARHARSVRDRCLIHLMRRLDNGPANSSGPFPLLAARATLMQRRSLRIDYWTNSSPPPLLCERPCMSVARAARSG